jgi:hypothetical protein
MYSTISLSKFVFNSGIANWKMTKKIKTTRAVTEYFQDLIAQRVPDADLADLLMPSQQGVKQMFHSGILPREKEPVNVIMQESADYMIDSFDVCGDKAIADHLEWTINQAVYGRQTGRIPYKKWKGLICSMTVSFDSLR